MELKWSISPDQASIQQAFDDMAQPGWGARIVTATSPPNSAVLVGVFTPMNGILLTRLSKHG